MRFGEMAYRNPGKMPNVARSSLDVSGNPFPETECMGKDKLGGGHALIILLLLSILGEEEFSRELWQ